MYDFRSDARRRLAPFAIVATLGLGLSGCEEGGATAEPGATDAKDDGLHLAYAEGFKLGATVSMSLEVSGMASGSMEVQAKGTIEAAKQGAGLRVVTRLDEVASYAASGDLKPQVEEGEPEPDMKAEMVGGETFILTDLLGEADEEGTKAMPENVKKKAEAEAAKESDDKTAQARLSRRSMGAGVITLPGLPEVGLEVGKEIKVPTEEEERDLGGRKLPVEVDSTYNLVKIDESSGSRIAHLSFKRAGSGAEEMQGQNGSVFVSYEEETEGTLVFDLDAKVPVSLAVEQATAISFGENSAEQYLELEAAYAPM